MTQILITNCNELRCNGSKKRAKKNYTTRKISVKLGTKIEAIWKEKKLGIFCVYGNGPHRDS